MAGEGLPKLQEIVSRVVVVRHRMAVSASETGIEWEFGYDLNRPVPYGGSETAPLAVEWVVTGAENILGLGHVGAVAAAQARWMTLVRGKVDRA